MSLDEHVANVELIIQQIPELKWTVQPSKVTRLSRDFHWFSPVLKKRLEDKRADAIAHPADIEQLKKLVSACVKHKVPLTLRGGATGNYGQLVPLCGGVLVDMTAINQIIDLGNGRVRAQAGIRLSDIEEQARVKGWELRCMPSTYRLATLGGLFGGGFGGIGSINYGPLAAPGNVLGITIMTVEENPEIIKIPAPQAMLLHHAYGTNGIVLDIELALAPSHDWFERLDLFTEFEDALNYADAIARTPGMVKRQLALFSSPIPDYFPSSDSAALSGLHAVISVMAAESDVLNEQLLVRFNGKNSLHQSSLEAADKHQSLMEYCWNHTTLHALKKDISLTYLQTAFDPKSYKQQIMDSYQLFKDEVFSHIEFLRDNDGNVTTSGLPLIRYTTEERLNEIMEILRTYNIHINNPHVFHIEDGKQGEIKPEVVSVKSLFDPYGLLNPGKLRGWDIRHQLPLDKNIIKV